jgi:prepilin-type N-terminal cleavage/methylation domain-containing protein
LDKMNRNNRKAGFTLIELMIVVAIIAIIAAVAIPKLVSARISANENASIATLRSIAAAQQQLQASAAIDTDADGGGEHGYFGELAGADPIRIFGTPPVIGAAGDLLDPTYLPVAFGNVITDGANGVVERQGYYYKMFLPDASGAAPVGAVAEDPAGGAVAGGMPGASNGELMWICYAWPVQATKTGNRTFMINQSGDVLATQNRATQAGGSYDGFVRVPAFDAALTAPLDISSEVSMASAGLASQDALVWTPVGS